MLSNKVDCIWAALKLYILLSLENSKKLYVLQVTNRQQFKLGNEIERKFTDFTSFFGTKRQLIKK